MNRHSTISLALLLSAVAAPVYPEPLTQAIETQVETNRAALAAQQAVDALDEQGRRMADEYRAAARQVEALAAYNAYLRQLVYSQAQQKASLESQIGALEATRREVVPLMLRMLDALDRYVQLDRPFRAAERKGRVTELKELMNRAEVGDAEKFRRLLEAYLLEHDYGKTIEAYRTELQLDEKLRRVDFLRVGRVALLYQTLDGGESGVWDSGSKRWQPLPADYNKPVRTALAVARKDIVPELLTIPVPVAEIVR